ncbi:MAG: GNAT family N-acetyltransferase [Spirosomataceae bacterium]
MIEISTATEAQLPEINRIAHATWPTTFGHILSQKQIAYMLDWMYSLPALQSQIRDKNHVFLLAKDETGYLGYASYELNYNGLPKTKIHKIYLLPSSQGKGVGAALMQAMGKVALENGNHTLSLNVNRYNNAVGFYEKIGFKVVGKEDIDIGEGFLMEDFIMEKTL